MSVTHKQNKTQQLPKKKISILDISLTSGGAEKVISLLLKKLVHHYDVTLILFYNDVHFPIPEGIRTYIFCQQPPSKRPKYLKLFDPLRFTIRYHRLLRKNKIQYAISFLAYPNLVNGIISIFNRSLKTYVSERGFPSDNTSSKMSFLISKLFYPLLYNRCDKLFSNSIYINEDLKTNFGVKIPMEVIYNPIELPKTNIIPESLKKNAEEFRIINVGTLNIRKNQKMILKAIKNTKFESRLTLVGGGPLEKELKEKVVAYGLQDNVTFTGIIRNVNDYLIDSNCFVLSSHTEGFPNVLLEAMSIGLPCISTNCLSGPLELLHGDESIEIPSNGFFKAKYGLLVNNNDDQGLSKALHFLFSNPQARVDYSKKSLARAKDYRLDVIYEEFREFIHN